MWAGHRVDASVKHLASLVGLLAFDSPPQLTSFPWRIDNKERTHRSVFTFFGTWLAPEKPDTLHFAQSDPDDRSAKVGFGVEVKTKMQANTNYTVHGTASKRAASSGELTFSGSELLLSVGVFLALVGVSIWLLVHCCVFAK
jgi:hypothetical protein